MVTKTASGQILIALPQSGIGVRSTNSPRLPPQLLLQCRQQPPRLPPLPRCGSWVLPGLQHAVMSGPSLGRCGIHCMSSQSLHLGRVWQTWKQVSSHFAKVTRPVVDIRSCRAKHHGSLGSTLPLQLAMHQTARSGFIAIQTTPTGFAITMGKTVKGQCGSAGGARSRVAPHSACMVRKECRRQRPQPGWLP